MKFRLCKSCESSISYLLFSRSSLFEYSQPLDNDHNREITLYIALFSHLTTKQVSLLRMPLNRIKRNKKEKSYFHKAHVEEWRREKREEESRAGESLLLYLFSGDSKGEDKCDVGHSAVVSGN